MCRNENKQLPKSVTVINNRYSIQETPKVYAALKGSDKSNMLINISYLKSELDI